jgi:uncharacterized membrane protein YraQ (UPF0718 family)
MSLPSLTLPAGFRIDPVWAAIVLIFAGLAVATPPQAAASLSFVASAAFSIAPFFLVSVGLAAGATAVGADNLVARAFVGHTAGMVVVASLFGALSPLCSCGVIPLIAALLTIGVPLPAVMAFWLSSPLMDPAMFVLTASILGTDFAVAKTIAAVGTGLIGGFGTWGLVAVGGLADPLRAVVGGCGCTASRLRNPKAVVWAFWREPARRAVFLTSARSNGLLLGKMLVLAFTLESLMSAWVPAGAVAAHLGGTGIGAILVATAIGIPAYLNGSAALPLVHELILQGMAPGAGMAFLIGGGVTSIPAAIAVWAIARPPVFAAYLGFAVISAVTSGLLYQIWSSWL